MEVTVSTTAPAAISATTTKNRAFVLSPVVGEVEDGALLVVVVVGAAVVVVVVSPSESTVIIAPQTSQWLSPFSST